MKGNEQRIKIASDEHIFAYIGWRAMKFIYVIAAIQRANRKKLMLSTTVNGRVKIMDSGFGPRVSVQSKES